MIIMIVLIFVHLYGPFFQFGILYSIRIHCNFGPPANSQPDKNVMYYYTVSMILTKKKKINVKGHTVSQ